MEIKEIYIKSEFIKLDQFLKFAGVITTGGQAKEMILGEFVLINGIICTERGKKLRKGDKISIKEDKENGYEKDEYIINKN